MWTLLRTLPLPQLLKLQLPAFGASLVIAEAFYKWHSFTLECLGFLATWAVIDGLLQAVSGAVARKRQA